MSISIAAYESMIEKLVDCQSALAAERARADALQAFKDYVHKRLDEAGVPVDPESPHKAAGCRIGGRLDAVFADRDRLRATLDFYARLDHYARRKRGVPSPIQDDKGKRARAALEAST